MPVEQNAGMTFWQVIVGSSSKQPLVLLQHLNLLVVVLQVTIPEEQNTYLSLGGHTGSG
jgi:hypothetical protein